MGGWWSMSRQKLHRYFGSFFLLLVTVTAAVALIWYRQGIIDHVRAYQYQPSAAAADIREDLRLTDLGSLYYNASETVVEPAEAFNRDCRQHKETNNPILGCYVNQRIYIFDITNDKLEGIEETTAAHELLHAAYERLDTDDRQALKEELMTVYQRVKTPELEQRMEYYRKSEPGQEMNELYAILGTEVDGLGHKLESHYAAFFKNRQRILGFYRTYSSVFDKVSSQLKQLEADINNRTKTTNAQIKAYNAAVSDHKDDVAAFNQRSARTGGFESQAEFDAARASLVARQAELDQTRQRLLASIDTIEKLRVRYNELVEQYNELSKSINSSLAPTPKL